MQDTTVTDVLAVDVEQQAAMDLHLRIKANLEMAASALLEACRGLKEMKEGDRYKALGFERFEDYTESALGIKSRMAYYYISTYDRLGPDLIAENAGLGITKLRLLAEVTPLDRAEFLDSNDLDGMSVEEVREAIRERDGLREQLSLFGEKGQAESGTDDRSAWLEEQLEAEKAARAKAEEELAAVAAAEEKDIKASEENIRAALAAEMAETLEAERQKAAEEAGAALILEKERELEEARKEAKEKAEKAAEKKIEEARAAALEEGRAAAGRELDAVLERERAEKEAASARAAELEKKLNLSASTETTAFALHFDQLQQHFAKLLQLVGAVREKDEGEGQRLAGALGQGLDVLRGKVEP